jgi:hypothetical protein
MAFSTARSKRELIEEALRVFVECKSAERRRATYLSRLKELRVKVAGVRLRTPPHVLIREDRDTR